MCAAENAGCRVLVVDDDIVFVSFICRILEKMNVQPTIAPTGSEALRRLVEEAFDGVLLDLRLPDFAGIHILRSARQRGIKVPVAILTGAATVSDTVDAMRMGALDVLEKPIRLPALRTLVATFKSNAKLCRPDTHDRDSGCPKPATDAWYASELVAHDIAAVYWSGEDIPTVSLWSSLLAVSSSVLRSRCERVRLRAKHCLDLGRVVRANRVMLSGGMPLSETFGCLDQRTVEALLQRGGLRQADLPQEDVGQLLSRQCFVHHDVIVRILVRQLTMN